MNAIRLLIRYGSASIRAQMQYPFNAVMLAIGQFTATIIDMVAIWALFARFGALEGWRLGDIAMFFGLVSVSFSIADFLSRGFDVLGAEFIKTGQLDQASLRPRTMTLQLVGNDMRLNRFRRWRKASRPRHRHRQSILLGHGKVAIAIWTTAGGVALFSAWWSFRARFRSGRWKVRAMNVRPTAACWAARFRSASMHAEQTFRSVVPIGCVACSRCWRCWKPDPGRRSGSLWCPRCWIRVSRRLFWRGAGDSRYSSTGS